MFDAFGQYGLQEGRDYGVKNRFGELAAEVILQNEHLELEQRVLTKKHDLLYQNDEMI